MAFFTLNPTLTPLSSSLKPNNLPSSSSSSNSFSCNCRLPFIVSFPPLRRSSKHVVRMAPDEEKLTRRSPLDFPIVSFSISIQFNSILVFGDFYVNRDVMGFVKF